MLNSVNTEYNVCILTSAAHAHCVKNRIRVAETLCI